MSRAATRVRGDLPLVLLDWILVVSAYLVLFQVRFDFDAPPQYWDRFLVFLPVAWATHLATTWAFGGYGRTWRHASIDEARRLLLAGLVSGVLLIAVFSWQHPNVPMTVLISGPIVVTFLFGMVRFQSRLFAFQRSTEMRNGLRVAVVGAGVTAGSALREMQANPRLGLVPVAVVDDEPGLRWRSMHGVPIVGAIDDLASVITEYEVNQVIVALPSGGAEVVRRVADAATATQVPVRVVPAAEEWVNGTPSVRDARDLRIEDLLGRAQVDLDLEPVHELLRGRRVLVTGGGGWIGAEIVRQVCGYSPAAVFLLDHDETHLHDASHGLGPMCESALVDIRDPAAVGRAFARIQPEIVFHAAAHKHVPILEDHACEAARTNVFGTQNVVDACKLFGVTHLVCISTDKAARPTSVMGASKWLAEQLLLADAPEAGRYCAVRFGNVLGSRGSVIPTFQRQIAAGGPVTVTDRRMTRYFMSTDEAVRLVLLAAAHASAPKLLALEMGQPVNIYELANRMIRLCGLQPGRDIELRVTGMRPGENLDEVVLGPAEHLEPGSQGPIMSIVPVQIPERTLRETLDRLEAACVLVDHDTARSELLAIAAPAVPEDHDVTMA